MELKKGQKARITREKTRNFYNGDIVTHTGYLMAHGGYVFEKEGEIDVLFPYEFVLVPEEKTQSTPISIIRKTIEKEVTTDVDIESLMNEIMIFHNQNLIDRLLDQRDFNKLIHLQTNK